MVGSFPFYIAVSVSVTPAFRRRLDKKFSRGAENQAFLVESVSAIQTLKAMAIEPQMQRRWEEQLAAYVGSSFDVLSLGNWSSQAVQLISKLVTALTLYYGAHLVIAGELRSVNSSPSTCWPGGWRSRCCVWRSSGRIFIRRGCRLRGLATSSTRRPSRCSIPRRRRCRRSGATSRFEHIMFRYRVDGPLVVHDMSLQITAGQVVGIVGPSGSGKSTLTKLVQRLYVPESGRVLIDGIDLTRGRCRVAAAAGRRRAAGECAVQPLDSRQHCAC